MCIETTTTYRSCVAVAVHTFVCLEFIEHTRRQLDNERCYRFERRFFSNNCSNCLCRDGGHCIRRVPTLPGDNGHTWTFEKEGAVRMPMDKGLEAERIETPEETEKRKLKKYLQNFLARKYELAKCNEIMEEVIARQTAGKRRKTDDPMSSPYGNNAVKPPATAASILFGGGDEMAMDTAIARIKKEDDEDGMQITAPEFKRPDRGRIRKLEEDIADLQAYFTRQGWAPPSESEKLLFMPDYNLQDRIDQFKEIHLGPPTAPRLMLRSAAKESKAKRRHAKKEAKKEAKKIKGEATGDILMDEHEDYKLLEDWTGM